MLASTVAAYAQYQMNVFSIDLITAYQISASRFAFLFTAPMLPAIFLSIPLGKLSDKIGYRNAIQLGLAFTILGLTGRIFAESYSTLWICMAFSGALLNGVDGNFGGKSAGILLEKYPHEDLIFTAPRENALKKYKEMGIETRVADFNNAETLVETFKGADTVVLISMYAYFDSIGVPRTTEEMWADTAKNFPFCSDGMVTFGKAIRQNQMSVYTNDFEKLTGRKPLFVRQIFEDFSNHLIGNRTSTDN